MSDADEPSASGATARPDDLVALLENLTRIVAAARAQRGISTRALAAEVGLSSATISDFERGEHDLTVRKAVPLVRWVLAGAPAPGATTNGDPDV